MDVDRNLEHIVYICGNRSTHLVIENRMREGHIAEGW